MKRIITFLVIILSFAAVCSGAEKKFEKVVFATKLHCENCVKKVVENISFCKGVKDLDVSLEKQTITVTFDPKKTDASKLSSEIKALGYPANAVCDSACAACDKEKKDGKCTK